MARLTYPGINHFFELNGTPLGVRQAGVYSLEMKRIDEALGVAAAAPTPEARAAAIAEARRQRDTLETLLASADSAIDYVARQAEPIPGA